MATYCYTNKRRETIERNFPMGKAPSTVLHKKEMFVRDIPAEYGDRHHTPGNWPMLSVNGGCGESQIGEMQQFLADRGVPTEFNSEGDAILRSRGHRKRFNAARGFVDKDGGYGD